MKKTILFAILLGVSSVSFAQVVVLNSSASNSKTTIASGSGAGQCEMIASGQTAVIQLSTDVVGTVDCSSSAAGMGTAHPKGKGKSYYASSNGGKLVETSATTDFANATEAQTAATTAAAAGKNAS